MASALLWYAVREGLAVPSFLCVSSTPYVSYDLFHIWSMTGSLEKFSLPNMKKVAFTDTY